MSGKRSREQSTPSQAKHKNNCGAPLRHGQLAPRSSLPLPIVSRRAKRWLLPNKKLFGGATNLGCPKKKKEAKKAKITCIYTEQTCSSSCPPHTSSIRHPPSPSVHPPPYSALIFPASSALLLLLFILGSSQPVLSRKSQIEVHPPPLPLPFWPFSETRRAVTPENMSHSPPELDGPGSKRPRGKFSCLSFVLPRSSPSPQLLT